MEGFKWLQDKAKNVYSQNGEDGVLEAIFKRIGEGNKTCFEVGAGDGRFFSNVENLIEKGWRGILVEADIEKFTNLEEYHKGHNVTCFNTIMGITENNIDDLLTRAGAPHDIQLVVIDVDGQDYYVFNSMLRYEPKVVIVEFNPNIRDASYIPRRGAPSLLDGQPLDQAGHDAIVNLGWGKLYRPVATLGCNIIFVHQKYLELLIQRSLPGVPLKLNLGSGESQLPGYVNMDIRFGDSIYPLEFDNDSVVEIRASHVFEHFSHTECMEVLKEWVRVLVPGGIIKIAVPDARKVMTDYLEGNPGNPQGYLMGGHVNENDYHKCIYDENLLTHMFYLADCYQVRRWDSELTDCASLPISLNLQARKKMVVENGQIFSIMSTPRVGFTANQFCCTKAFRNLNIDCEMISGAFWGKCLSHGMDDHMSDSKYLLTLDYDTVFTWEDVLELYRLMETYPEMCAVFAVQMKREGNGPLFVVRSRDDKPVTTFGKELLKDEFMQVDSGHFGLTLFRSECLKHMPKPRFLPEPARGEKGWDDNTVDDDIMFWRKWADCGYNLFQANRVVIGHCEQIITWPSQELTTVYQNLSDYNKSGSPKGIWR